MEANTQIRPVLRVRNTFLDIGNQAGAREEIDKRRSKTVPPGGDRGSRDAAIELEDVPVSSWDTDEAQPQEFLGQPYNPEHPGDQEQFRLSPQLQQTGPWQGYDPQVVAVWMYAGSQDATGMPMDAGYDHSQYAEMMPPGAAPGSIFQGAPTAPPGYFAAPWSADSTSGMVQQVAVPWHGLVGEMPKQQSFLHAAEPPVHASASSQSGRRPIPGPLLDTGQESPTEFSPSQPQTVNVSSSTDGSYCVDWVVDARKLRGNDRQVVSPPFMLPLGEGGHNANKATFKLMLNASMKRDTKGGSCFKKVQGKGCVHLKCEDDIVNGVGEVTFRISLGGSGRVVPVSDAVIHNFSRYPVAGLPEDKAPWDFSRAVDEASLTFVVRLEAAPASLGAPPWAWHGAKGSG